MNSFKQFSESSLPTINSIVPYVAPPKGKRPEKTAPAYGGGQFEVYKRDTRGLPGNQDGYVMYIHGNSRMQYFGTHVSVAGAMKLAKNHGLLEK